MFRAVFDFALHTSFRSLIKRAKPNQKLLLRGNSLSNITVVIESVHDDMIVAHSPDKRRCLVHRVKQFITLEIQSTEDGELEYKRHSLRSATVD